MRIVFVHGINNQSNSSEWIARDWANFIERALNKPGLLAGCDVVAPFYGKRLAELTRDRDMTVRDAVAQSATGVPDADLAFAESLVGEIAAGLGIDTAEVEAAADLDVTTMTPGARALLPTLALIERWSPGTGDFVMRFVKEANTYFRGIGAKDEIDALVKPALTGHGSQIVIGHSLGSVVTFDLLRNNATDTRLYVTLGSPLPLASVQRQLGPPLRQPSGVGRWLNAIDPDDVVGLGRGLVPPFAIGIENLTDLRNGWDSHSIRGYLSDARVANAIATALSC